MSVLEIVHVLGTKVSEKTGKIVAQIGSIVGKGQVYADNVAWLQPPGFYSLPSTAVTGKSAPGVVKARFGNTEVILGVVDDLGATMKGALGPGEAAMCAAGADGKGQARVLCKGDGSVNIYSRKGNAADGGGMLIQLDAANDTIRLLNSKGHGMIIDADGVKIVTPGSALTLEASGNCSLIATKQCQCDGATVLLGSIAAPVVNAVCVGPAGLVAVASAKVLCALA